MPRISRKLRVKTSLCKKFSTDIIVKTYDFILCLRFSDKALPTAAGLSIVLSEAFCEAKTETDHETPIRALPENASCHASDTVDKVKDYRTQSQNVTRAISQSTTRSRSSQIKHIFEELWSRDRSFAIKVNLLRHEFIPLSSRKPLDCTTY